MRLVFMGTPDFAVSALSALLDAGLDIVAVYTRAPQPSGRGMALQPSPVAVFAEARGLRVRTPRSLKSAEEQAAFAALGADAAAVVAYGLILPQPILAAARLGCFNLHASLLPRWRGAAPIQRAILAGDSMTGVEVMRMEAGLDTGPVLASATTPIGPDDTAGSLHDRLAALGAALLPPTLRAVAAGLAVETPQTADGVTYAAKISSAEARIDWRHDGAAIDRQIRGLAPFPGAWFEVRGRKGPERVKALASRPADGEGPPGEVLAAGTAIVVACGGGAVAISALQRAGRGRQSAEEFLRGFPLRPGDALA